MNHTVAKLRLKATTPPGIARAKAEFELELRHTASKDKRLLARQVKELSGEAKHYEQILINAFLRLGQGWVAKSGDLANEGKKKKKHKVQRVRFSQCFTTPERIYYRVEINRLSMGITTKNVLPHLVTVRQLTHEDTLYELSHACTRLVTAIDTDYNHGVWIVVNRGVGSDGVPIHVSYNDTDILDELADAYSVNYFGAPVIVGVGQYRKTYFLEFSEHPHWLVAGTSGGGKSNIIRTMISTWIRFMSPDDIRLVMIDLKQMEFKRYSKIPHLLLPVIIEGDKAVYELNKLMQEVERRKAILAASDAVELGEWNKSHPDIKMPRIVVIIDELAELMLSSGKQVRIAIETLLSRFSNIGRAVGVHIIAATQLPQSRVIPRQITGNMTAVIGARTGSYHESITIMGKGGLELLPVVKGRMLLKVGADRVQLQTPHLMPEDSAEAIAIAYGRHAGVIYLQGQYPMLDPDGTVCYIADQLGGKLGPGFLWKVLAPLAVPHKQLLAMLGELIDKGEIAANGRIFDVVKAKNSYILAERIPAAAPMPDYTQDFTIDPQTTYARLGLSAAPALLMLPAPGETSVEGQPTPKRRKAEPVPEPEPISPLMMTSDQIMDKFIAECCNRGPRVKDSAANLYKAYGLFCEELGVMQFSQNAFIAHLKRNGFTKFRNERQRGWIGIQVALPMESIA